MGLDFLAKTWTAAKRLIGAAPWAAFILLILFSYFALQAVTCRPATWTFLGLDKEIIVRAIGSLFASAIFFGMVQILNSLQHAPARAQYDYFERIHGRFGIKDVFQQRGGPEALGAYEQALRNASKRIWALGLTNRRFVNHHFEELDRALSRCEMMDLRVFFADPAMTVSWDEDSLAAIDLQSQFEQKTGAVTDWAQHVNEEIETLKKLPSGKKAGRTRVMLVRSVCFFTCFVIDDDVFFFPMLARGDSSQDPTIQVGTDSLLGSTVIQHVDWLVKHPRFAQVVLDTKGALQQAGNMS